MTNETFSDRLKLAMQAKQFKQVDLIRAAQRRGVKLGKSHVSQYVSGKTVPRSDILHFLADVLQVDPDWLLAKDSTVNYTADTVSDSTESCSDPSAASLSQTKTGGSPVTRVVEWCKRQGLNIVLDLHKAYGYDFNNAGDQKKNILFTNKMVQKRFVNLWIKIAEHYANETHVAFELLNEVVEQENAEAWNLLIAETVDAIRRIARDTIIIYGGIQWNSVKTLKLLEKPKDENILFTFHFYEPLLFTHQKAHWVPTISQTEDIYYPEAMDYYRTKSLPIGYQGEVFCKAQSQTMGTEFITEMVMEAVTAAKNAGVTLYCGEFGVIDQAPVEDTLRWFTDVDTVFRQFGIGCAVWTYKEMDFGLIGEHYAPIREQLLKLWNRK